MSLGSFLKVNSGVLAACDVTWYFDVVGKWYTSDVSDTSTSASDCWSRALSCPVEFLCELFGSASKVHQILDTSSSCLWCGDFLCIVVPLSRWDNDNNASLGALSEGLLGSLGASLSFDSDSLVVIFCFPLGGIVSQSFAHYGRTMWAGKV
jgi:hypothetical protein